MFPREALNIIERMNCILVSSRCHYGRVEEKLIPEVGDAFYFPAVVFPKKSLS